jgi:5'-3' exonuclease
MGIKKFNSMLQQLNLVVELNDFFTLNKFLRNHTNKSTNEKLKIAIDASLYLYKYIRAEKLNNNNLSFVDLFKKQIDKFLKYNIIPIYVFDGPSDELKSSTIENRLQKKCNALGELVDLIASDYIKKDIKKIIAHTISVSQNDIEKLQKFLSNNNVPYIISPCESDVLCAKLVKYNVADACLSEDMDMIINGCPTLIKSCEGKYYVYLYDNIVNTLDISSDQLCKFASLLGCDYSRSANSKINPITLLSICKKHNFNLQNILNEIIICDVHRKHFDEQLETSCGLSEMTDMLFDHNIDHELLQKINKYYCTAYKLLIFYNNDKDIHIELFNNSYKNQLYDEIIS